MPGIPLNCFVCVILQHPVYDERETVTSNFTREDEKKKCSCTNLFPVEWATCNGKILSVTIKKKTPKCKNICLARNLVC